MNALVENYQGRANITVLVGCEDFTYQYDWTVGSIPILANRYVNPGSIDTYFLLDKSGDFIYAIYNTTSG